MTTIFTNIQQLINTRHETRLVYGSELKDLPCVENAYLVIEDDEIAGYGRMDDFPAAYSNLQNSYNTYGKCILPCWCDSHTHLVFAGSREKEFVDKIQGLNYAEIAARGGGILNSAKKIHESSEDALFNLAWERLEEVGILGTGAIEIKSGYGLNTLDSLPNLCFKSSDICKRKNIVLIINLEMFHGINLNDYRHSYFSHCPLIITLSTRFDPKA